MKIHDIKIIEGYYFAILDGLKSFELRYNDRDYKVGDYIHFKPVLSSGEVQEKYDDKLWEITYVLNRFIGLVEDYVVLGIRLSDKKF